MKKLLLLFILVFVVFTFAACNKDKGKTSENSGTPSSSTTTSTEEPIVEETTVSEYIGVDRNGDDVKKMISQVIRDNKEVADENDKTSVQLKAFRGDVSATSDEEKLTKMYSYIGSSSSIYNTSVSGDNGKLIIIKQTEGTPSDPDIPLETNEDTEFPYYGDDFGDAIEAPVVEATTEVAE